MSKNARLQDYFSALAKVAAGDIRTDQYSRMLYSTDASIYQVMPFGVFLPENMEDVQAAVELSAQYGVPILPRTSGSSLAGQAVNEAVVIDFTKYLNRIIEVNVEEKWVCVQPGLVLDALNARLKQHDLQFGPDPASSNRAAIGGIVANNSTGSHSILYGMTADHVLATKVFLNDGSEAEFSALDDATLAQKANGAGLENQIYARISELADSKADAIRTGTPRHWRRCGGYNIDRFVAEGITYKVPQQPGFNLAKLICGSEGTLAVMSEITLNLVPTPQKTGLAIVQFQNLYEALSATPIILEVNPSAVELLDHLGLSLCRKTPQFARLLKSFLSGDPNCLLITEFYGESENELLAKIENLAKHLKSNLVNAEVVPAMDARTQQNVWAVRKAGLGLMMSIKGDHKPIPFIEDAAVPVEHLADYVTQIEKFCNDLGSQVAYYAHASAGCVHIRPLINAKVASDIEKLPKISQFSVQLLGEFGGSLSSEHGDGRSRSWMNERFYGKELYGIYKEIKKAFDPENRLNPGMIVDPQHITENLRYGDGYSTIQLETGYDFSEEQGFHRAVEMCNGAAICRKSGNGTMCPSFMVTHEEEHSTRGRANALRAALSGKLPAGSLTSKRMFEVMDLCIECKACKSECPSSVDMAKIKFEFLGQYYRKNRVPLRSRLFADVAKFNRLSKGVLKPVTNFIYRSRFVRSAMHALLGIAMERELPALAPISFVTWFEDRDRRQTAPAEYGQVVLFCDTFNNYHEPSVLIAATEILEKLGYEVILSHQACCGRPMISKGLVEKARKAALSTVEALHPFAEKGLPVIGLEPSCLLTFRDENLSLLPGDEHAKTLAERSYLFEEFIAKIAVERDLRTAFAAGNRRVLLHGHCHQKSVVGTEPVTQMLRLPDGTITEEVDSGCCGMAGSFGYESEHVEISLKMAERSLLPAVRGAAPDTAIAASGFSCRHQIQHGSGRRALHPVEILHQALLGD
ncbi:MAG: FAD-binding protein [Deferribacteres bacterium]|nr:FAD-binding protein [Deferribacteres bacterium]